MWQADHTPLDVLLLDEAGQPAQAWLRVIEDDYSRAIASFRLSFQEPTSLTTALALRQAIWRKEHPRWPVCGIPSVFYSAHVCRGTCDRASTDEWSPRSASG